MGINHSCKVQDPRTQPECENQAWFPPHIKVPKVLVYTKVQVNVDSYIELEQQALEIKRIKKDVVLNQCELVPTKFHHSHHQFATEGKLYLEGYIRKNIEYATNMTNTNSAVCGDIRHTTAHVPFHCVTKITFPHGHQPIFKKRFDSESDFLREDELAPRFDKKLFSEEVFYNEQPFCELEGAKFHQLDIACTLTPVIGIEDEQTFRRFREKVVLDLFIKVLQVQQVNIHSHYRLKEQNQEQNQEENQEQNQEQEELKE